MNKTNMTIDELNKRREYINADRATTAAINEVFDIAAKALAPQWTTTPPTKPGWYWARLTDMLGDYRKGDIVPLKVSFGKHRHGGEAEALVAPVPGWELAESLAQCADLWSGPIDAPPLPEGKR